MQTLYLDKWLQTQDDESDPPVFRRVFVCEK